MPAEINLEPTNCPFCGSDSYSVYMHGQDRYWGVPGVFQLVRCNECRHIYMNPRPTAESIPACYPACYGPHQPSPASAKTTPVPSQPARQPWYLSRWARAMPGLRRLYYWLTDTGAEIIPELPPGQPRAIELGCAGGRFLEQLRLRGWDALGVELMPEPAAEARRRGFEVRLGTLEQARFPDAAFNAAFAFMVIEHLANPLAELQEIHRILKPHGWFVFSVPNTGSWEAWLFGRRWSDHKLPEHLQHFTVSSIKRFLQKAGFSNVHVVHQRTVYGLIGSLGVVWSETFPRSRIGPMLTRWHVEGPPRWAYLGIAALIKLLVPILGSGRLTILARKP